MYCFLYSFLSCIEAIKNALVYKSWYNVDLLISSYECNSVFLVHHFTLLLMLLNSLGQMSMIYVLSTG